MDRKKLFSALKLIFFLILLASIPLSVYVIKTQRMEVRRKASSLKNLITNPGFEKPALASSGLTANKGFEVRREKILFYSNRDGDFEIYTMNPDGSEIKQLTFNKVNKVGDKCPSLNNPYTVDLIDYSIWRQSYKPG